MTTESKPRVTRWSVVRFVVGLALAALALSALNGQRGELVNASNALGHLDARWLAVAAVSELASFICFGAMQRRLLRAGGVRVRLVDTTALSLAAGAIASSLPGGPAFASIYAFRFYRRRGANDAVSGWILLGTLVCAALALALVATAGVALAARQGASYDLVGVTLSVLVISAVADAVVWQRKWLAELALAVLRLTRRVSGWPRREAVEVITELFERLEALKFTWGDLVATILAGAGNWLFDCGALAVSFSAVGAPIPWRGLLLAYGAGQLAANLPITPGGLGVVEGSLTIAVVAFGGTETSTISAVLCYRLVSFWGYLPVGWMSWLSFVVRNRRADRHDLAAANESQLAVPQIKEANR